MPYKKHLHSRPGVRMSYGLFKICQLIILTHSVLCDSDSVEYAQSVEHKKQDDLAEINVFQEENVVSELVINENHIFEDEPSSMSSDKENAQSEDYIIASTEAVVAKDAKSLENQTISDGNVTIANTTSGSENKTSVKVECLLGELPEGEIPSVQLINGTMLMKIFSTPANNSTAGECSVVMFYSPYCVFSARAAPHFNALARVYPGVKCYAVDAMSNGNLHLRYGLVAVPNVMLFHKGKPIARFNETHLNLEKLATFVEKYTGLQYNGTLNVTSADMSGPVPSTLSKKVDYVLILAWIFTICCLCYGFSKSALCHKIVETVKRTWQEAEAQHEHED